MGRIMSQQAKRLIPLTLLILLGALAWLLDLHKYLSFETLQQHQAEIKQLVRTYPFLSVGVYLLLYITLVALSIPGAAIFTIIGGFLFPQPLSTLYVVLGATIGAMLLFYSARFATGDALKRKLGPFYKKMEKGMHKDAASYLLFLRFVPIFPFWVVNLLPAILGVPATTFLWTTAIGIIPGAFAYCQVGEGLGSLLQSKAPLSLHRLLTTEMKIAFIALGVLSLLPLLLKKLKRQAKENK